MPLGHISVKNFADGEIGVQVNENVRGKDVYIIQPTSPPGKLFHEPAVTKEKHSASLAHAVIVLQLTQMACLHTRGTGVNDHLVELMLLISTFRRASARTITAVIPYYGRLLASSQLM